VGGVDCRAGWGSTCAALSLDGGLAAIALDIHLEDRGVMDEAVDGGERHGLAGENLSPFAEGLIGRDEDGAALVAGADELEEDAGLGLILGDISQIFDGGAIGQPRPVDGVDHLMALDAVAGRLYRRAGLGAMIDLLRSAAISLPACGAFSIAAVHAPEWDSTCFERSGSVASGEGSRPGTGIFACPRPRVARKLEGLSLNDGLGPKH
jgi:hypothetical protein